DDGTVCRYGAGEHLDKGDLTKFYGDLFCVAPTTQGSHRVMCEKLNSQYSLQLATEVNVIGFGIYYEGHGQFCLAFRSTSNGILFAKRREGSLKSAVRSDREMPGKWRTWLQGLLCEALHLPTLTSGGQVTEFEEKGTNKPVRDYTFHLN